jgi:hypothetical protein
VFTASPSKVPEEPEDWSLLVAELLLDGWSVLPLADELLEEPLEEPLVDELPLEDAWDVEPSVALVSVLVCADADWVGVKKPEPAAQPAATSAAESPATLTPRDAFMARFCAGKLESLLRAHRQLAANQRTRSPRRMTAVGSASAATSSRGSAA